MAIAIAQRHSTSHAAHLILYDGVCGLCNGLVQFVLKHDRRKLFHFAPLQGPVGQATLHRVGRDPHDLSTLYVLVDYQGPIPDRLSKGAAVLFVMTSLGWPWRAAAVLALAGRAVLDRFYELIATHRYRLWGRLDSCSLPPHGYEDRFVTRSE